MVLTVSNFSLFAEILIRPKTRQSLIDKKTFQRWRQKLLIVLQKNLNDAYIKISKTNNRRNFFQK